MNRISIRSVQVRMFACFACLVCLSNGLAAQTPSQTSPQTPAATPARPLTKQEREFALDYLKKTSNELADSIGGLSEAQWTHRPGPDRWTIAEVAEHIVVTERALRSIITDKLMKSPAAPPDKKSELTEQQIIEGITDRSKKFSAPDAIKPVGRWKTKEEVLKEFESVRGETAEYIKTTPDELRLRFAKHSVFGKEIDGLQWVIFMLAHCERHTLQIKEVKADPNYPKK